MGFYIRKGINFGPIRLNLSRRGMGLSLGVKGARIGTGPRGSYVHLGRKGLYYRKFLYPPSRVTQRPARVHRSSPPELITNFQLIGDLNAPTLTDASDAALVGELNRVHRRVERFPKVAALSTVILFTLVFLGADWLEVLTVLAVGMTLSVWARHVVVTHGTAVLHYDLDPQSTIAFDKLRASFQRLLECERAWNVDGAAANIDKKRHGGVEAILKRSDGQPRVTLPPRVRCNLEVPALKASRRCLYFFPDHVLVYDSSGVGHVSYMKLSVDPRPIPFTEEGFVPIDSEQVTSIWEHVNKDGSPDMRFRNNRRLSVMLYGQLMLSSTSGMREIFQCSVPAAAATFAAALKELRKVPPLASPSSELRRSPFSDQQTDRGQT